MDRNRGAALSGFIRVLCSNPSGDGAARAMVMGALAPLGGTAGQIYGSGRPATLELLGNFGWPAEDAVAFRTLATNLPLPACQAFTTASTVAVPSHRLHEEYPVLATGRAPGSPPPVPEGEEPLVVCVPIVWSEQPVGVLVAIIEGRTEMSAEEWQYLDGVAGALALWLLEQRRALIDNWRRSAPLPHAEITLSPIQHRLLELVGSGRTDAEIADSLDISMAMVRQDIEEIMKLIGTDDRDAAAGRAREIGLLPDRRARDGAR